MKGMNDAGLSLPLYQFMHREYCCSRSVCVGLHVLLSRCVRVCVCVVCNSNVSKQKSNHWRGTATVAVVLMAYTPLPLPPARNVSCQKRKRRAVGGPAMIDKHIMRVHRTSIGLGEYQVSVRRSQFRYVPPIGGRARGPVPQNARSCVGCTHDPRKKRPLACCPNTGHAVQPLMSPRD
jgi:hypothetical protein